MHRIHYLVWRRGFAPILFILAIALIVVSVGSGIYFATKKSTPSAIVEQPTSAQQIEFASTTLAAITPVADVKSVAQPATAYINCGESSKTANCLAEQVKNCSPAKGVVSDTASGLKVERVIDGYKGNDCSYRTSILSGTGNMAVLAGMNVDCLIPKATLSETIQGGSMTQEDMLSLCTGTFIELIRAQRVTAQ